MRNRFLAAAMLTAAAAACATARKPTERAMTIQEWKGQNGGPAEPGVAVAADRDAWELAWKRVGKDAPPADFASVVGVMVFLGAKPTGGWSPVFDEPEPRGDDLLVRYRTPKPGGLVTQAFTQPWKARLFPRPKGRVIVEGAPE